MNKTLLAKHVIVKVEPTEGEYMGCSLKTWTMQGEPF